MKAHLIKEQLHKDPRFKLALEHIPEDQHEMFEQVVLQFAEQFYSQILLKFAEGKYKMATGDK